MKQIKDNKARNLFGHQLTHVLITKDKGGLLGIEGKLGYEFKDKLWLMEALTHKSYLNDEAYREEMRERMKYGKIHPLKEHGFKEQGCSD